jgi:hypothetical protein
MPLQERTESGDTFGENIWARRPEKQQGTIHTGAIAEGARQSPVHETGVGKFVFQSHHSLRRPRASSTAASPVNTSSGIECRLYDMRHTFATRFALAGGSLPVLAKILGHADLSLLMRYVHPGQADMDRAMEWYSNTQTSGPELEKMLLESGAGSYETEGWPRPPFGPPTARKVAQIGPSTPNLHKRKIS